MNSGILFAASTLCSSEFRDSVRGVKICKLNSYMRVCLNEFLSTSTNISDIGTLEN